MWRITIIGSLVLAVVFPAAVADSQVRPGETAPLYKGVDENGRLIDMADFIDGTPLLFLYTSST